MDAFDQTLTPYLSDWLKARAADHPDDLAMVDLFSGRQTTYEKMCERSCRIAGVLKNTYGIRPGDRVMVAAYNDTDLYEILFACWRLGAIYMPVNWRLAPPELKAITADATPSLVIADRDFESLVDGLDLPVWWRDRDAALNPFEDAITAATPVEAFATPDFERCTNLLYTSGTTGQPKGVISTWRMQAMAVQQAEHVLLGSATKTLTAAPMFHTAGLNSFALPLFYYGGTVHIMRHWDADAALKYLSNPELGITHTLGVPVQFQMMTQCDGFEEATFDSVERAGVGGAPVPEDLLYKFQAKGMTLCNSYGMTEVFGVATLPPEKARDKLGSVGWHVIGTEIRIADDDDQPVAVNVSGEIQIKSRGVTPGYWQAPDLTTASRPILSVTSDGWYRTGDIGRFDDEGALYVVDRKKDMFISGGENVYPAEVENALAMIPEVREAAVIGVTDDRWGEVGHAIVVLHDDNALDAGAVRTRCAEHLAKYKVPKHVSFTDALPRSAQGKVQKQDLKERYA